MSDHELGALIGRVIFTCAFFAMGLILLFKHRPGASRARDRLKAAGVPGLAVMAWGRLEAAEKSSVRGELIGSVLTLLGVVFVVTG